MVRGGRVGTPAVVVGGAIVPNPLLVVPGTLVEFPKVNVLPDGIPGAVAVEGGGANDPNEVVPLERGGGACPPNKDEGGALEEEDGGRRGAAVELVELPKGVEPKVTPVVGAEVLGIPPDMPKVEVGAVVVEVEGG